MESSWLGQNTADFLNTLTNSWFPELLKVWVVIIFWGGSLLSAVQLFESPGDIWVHTDCTFLCCFSLGIRNWDEKKTPVTTRSFKNVASSHPITLFPLEILIDTSSNRNSNLDFCFQKRNRAWLYFYSTIQILRTTSLDSPIFWSCTWQWCAYIIDNRHRSVREESGKEHSWRSGVFVAAHRTKCRISLHWSPKLH